MHKDQPAFSGEVRRVRCSGYRNGESVKRKPIAKQEGSQASFFAPRVGIRCFTGVTGIKDIQDQETLVEGKGIHTAQTLMFCLLRAPLLPELLAVPSICARHMLS